MCLTPPGGNEVILRKQTRRKNVFRKILSYLVILMLTVIAVFFPSALPAFAIPPPFPAVYWLHQEVSALNANCWQLKDVDVDQAENTTTSIKPKTSTSEFQWWPGGINRTASGTTNGYGWIFDSPLNGKYDSLPNPDSNTADDWTFYVRIRLSAGGAPAAGTIRAYVFRYDGSSTYTPLFTASKTGVSPSSTATTYNFTYDPDSDLDMQGQYLYVHYTWQTTNSSGASNSTVIDFHVEGTGLAAADKARIQPGSSSIPTLGWPLLFLTIAFFVGMLLKKGVLRARVA